MGNFMKEELSTAKVLVEKINKDLETLTNILQKNYKELGWNFDVGIQYDTYEESYKIRFNLDKLERISW